MMVLCFCEAGVVLEVGLDVVGGGGSGRFLVVFVASQENRKRLRVGKNQKMGQISVFSRGVSTARICW